jgi:hypothetical protein
MTCREFAGFLADYSANELAADVRATFDDHLRLCPNCRRYLTGYQATIAIGRLAFDDPDARVPADVPDELVAAILVARQPADRPR